MLWRRPLSTPPWLSALLLIGTILLAISALPMLASAITPDSGDSGASNSAAAAQAKGKKAGAKAADGAQPKAGKQAEDTAARARAAERTAAKPCPVPSPSPSLSASPTSGDSVATDCADPLPRSGGSSTPRIAIAVALLFGGLIVLSMIGFSGERPWPGRYVRRI